MMNLKRRRKQNLQDNTEILKDFEYALDKYGKFATALEKKDQILKKCITEKVSKPNLSSSKLKEALVFAGNVLEADDGNGIYVASVDVGRAKALTVCKLSQGTLSIASYAKEGLIKQHLAEKAIQSVMKRI